MAHASRPNNREVALLTVLLNGELYGRDIRNRYVQLLNEDIPLGSLYVTLDRMAEKGYVRSRLGESRHERGGNRRKYYEITGFGSAALTEATRRVAALYGGIAHV